MNRLFRHAVLALSIVTLAFSGCKTTDKLSTKEVVLRFKPQKGDSYTMGTNMTMIMDGAQSMTMNMNMDTDITVGEVEKEGAFFLDNVIKKITMSMNGDMMSIDYDSANPDTDNPATLEMHNTMGKLLDKSMVSKLNNRGEILETPDYGKIFGDDPKMAGQIDQMNQSLKSSFIYYPETAQKVGDSWNAATEVSGQMPMTQNFTYTVREITPTSVLLDISGTIEFSPEAMVSGSGDFSGNMVINKADGFVKTSNVKQKIKMSVMGMNMNASTDVSIIMTKK